MTTIQQAQSIRAVLSTGAALSASLGAQPGVRVLLATPSKLSAVILPTARVTATVSTSPTVVEGEVSVWQDIQW